MYIYGLVLYNIPNILQPPLDPPRHRQHQVLQVLAVTLLQEGSEYDGRTTPTLSAVSQISFLRFEWNFCYVIPIHTHVVRKEKNRSPLLHHGRAGISLHKRRPSFVTGTVHYSMYLLPSMIYSYLQTCTQHSLLSYIQYRVYLRKHCQFSMNAKSEDDLCATSWFLQQLHKISL